MEIIEQPPHASPAWSKSVVGMLQQKRNILVLAVQGGILSEGVDLPGEQCERIARFRSCQDTLCVSTAHILLDEIHLVSYPKGAWRADNPERPKAGF